MTQPEGTDPTTHRTRRTVLRGAVVAGVAVPFLAACGNDSSSPGSTGGPSAPSGNDSGGNDTGAATTQAGGGGGAVATTADVPEGGGLILSDPQVVITQPAAGEFKGFSSICTHQGCQVDNVSDGTINCICHGSMYSIEDGSVVGGPAPSPLPEQKLTVTGKDITLA